MNVFRQIWNLVRRPIVRYTGPVAGNGAGMLVTNETALAHASVWACVRIISETIATLDWQILQEANDSRTMIKGTPLGRILNRQANGEMTAFTWREVMLAHVLLTGNHYSEIQRDAMGRVVALWPLVPETVRVVRDPRTWQIRYHCWQPYDGEVILEPRDVLHIKGLGWDGVTGYSIITMARRSIGSGLAMDEYGANFYRNGAHVGLVFTYPNKLSEKAQDNFKQSLKEAYTGPGNSFRSLVLEEGMTLTKAQMSMVDAQYLESRKFSVNEICRWFRVPPHKVAELDRSTNNNIEHQSIEFVRDAVIPWCNRVEQEVEMKLMGRAANQATHLAWEPLLHGTMLDRFTALEKARNGGWYSANDCRRELSMNPIDNGDIYLQPLNYVEAGDEPDEKPADPPARVVPMPERRSNAGA